MRTGHKAKVCLLGLENLAVFTTGFETRRVGGEQVQQSLLADALIRRGFQVSMVCIDDGQPSPMEINGATVYASYREHGGLPILRYVYPRWIKLWSALRRADADVYYTSCAGMQVGLLALFCRQYRRKFIYRIAHDNDCDPGRLLIRLRRDMWLYEYGLRHADGILAQSLQQQDALRRNYGLSSEVARMLVGKPLRRIPYKDRDIDVLWVNNIRQFKRPDLALDLAARAPDVSVHIVGGPNEPDLYDQIRHRADSLPNVTFHGAVSYHDVGPFYDRAKLFINTSDIEGFPNSYLQSWIRGTPVIAFFDPDKILERERLGQAVKTLSEMEVAVRLHLSDDTLLHSAGQRCIDYMTQTFSEDRVLEPYLDCIDRLSK
jgi:glycosyltransferase involved in cell wall biosynthesis